MKYRSMRSDDRSWPIRLTDLNKCYESCNNPWEMIAWFCGKKQKWPNMRRITASKSVTLWAIHVRTSLVCWFPHLQKTTFHWLSMFQRRGNHDLKGATVKGKNKTLFPLRVFPKIIENNYRETANIKLRQYSMAVFLYRQNVLNEC